MSNEKTTPKLSFADEMKMKALLPMVKPFFGKIAAMLEVELLAEIDKTELNENEDSAIWVVDNSGGEAVFSICAVSGTTIVRPVKSFTKDSIFNLINKLP